MGRNVGCARVWEHEAHQEGNAVGCGKVVGHQPTHPPTRRSREARGGAADISYTPQRASSSCSFEDASRVREMNRIVGMGSEIG